MEELLNKVLSEEAEKFDISVEALRGLAEKGCKIAFKDDLETRIKTFGEGYFNEDSLKELILVCAYGGLIPLMDGLEKSLH